MAAIDDPTGMAGQDPGQTAPDGVVERPGVERRGMDPKLLELIVCPLTKTTLDYDAVRQELVSRAAKLAFPIRDGIPIMLSDEARKLED